MGQPSLVLHEHLLFWIIISNTFYTERENVHSKNVKKSKNALLVFNLPLT